MPENTVKKQEPTHETPQNKEKTRKTRKHNTPKDYPNKGTGDVKNPRIRCPECAKKDIKKYMNKVNKKYMIEGKLVILKPLMFCKCGYVEINWDELAKVPD